MDVASILQFLTRDVAPPAQPLVDYSLSSDSDSDTVLLGHWADRLGPRPTDADLEAAAASPGYAAWCLGAARRARMEDVYARTRELESQGFTFQGQRFGLSADTQITWTALLVGASAGMVTFPKSVGVLDNGLFSIPDIATLQAFCGAAMARGEAIKAGEAELRHLVYDAATVEAVAAVQDTRE